MHRGPSAWQVSDIFRAPTKSKTNFLLVYNKHYKANRGYYFLNCAKCLASFYVMQKRKNKTKTEKVIIVKTAFVPRLPRLSVFSLCRPLVQHTVDL